MLDIQKLKNSFVYWRGVLFALRLFGVDSSHLRVVRVLVFCVLVLGCFVYSLYALWSLPFNIFVIIYKKKTLILSRKALCKHVSLVLFSRNF